jgi:glycine/D-amino acid oxidase-like deaminating enzyme/nitrite reductase/ring-hydroxylating ferredoxin subunit
MTVAAAKHASLWLETAPAREFPALDEDVSVDVAVVGAGIVGVTAALLLKREGATVALVEADRVGAGVTGHTTAKVTSLHGLTYATLRSKFGDEGARLYGKANEAALARMERFVEEERIDCDWRRRAAFTYTEDESELDKVREEAEVAHELGLPASFDPTPPLPWEVAGAVRFDDQAEFHPQKYVQALAAKVPGDGSHVVERSRALRVRGGPQRVETERAAVYASDVVVATHLPFLDRGLFFARCHPERSYCLAAPLRGPGPDGMFITASPPTRSVRLQPSPDGDGELLVISGEGHKPAHGGDTMERVERVAAWTREHFDIGDFAYRWSAQDNMPMDGAPYVGRLLPATSGLWVATGFKKWGLAGGTAAAMMLADEIMGRECSWREAFDASRVKPVASAGEFVKENADVAARFFGDRLRGLGGVDPAELAPGEGKVGRSGRSRVAVSKDEQGRVHAVSATCTHMYCEVGWNSADSTWDCPCHGSRFGPDGAVLHGPATKPLAPKSLG